MVARKSLSSRANPLATADRQLELIEQASFPAFTEKLAIVGLHPLKPTSIDVLQVNVGKMCNQVCVHCHVDAGPDRREVMTRHTMQQCLDALAKNNIATVDITGGAPEMNPDFRWFVEEIKKLGRHVIVRCNLTIVVANKKYHDLPEFFRSHQVEVVSSLPFYQADRTDRQRGDGVFKDSIQALRMLNAVGYGVDPTLKLNLVYNPSGAFLPASQQQLEQDFKRVLEKDHQIVFNNLYCITNMPVSRYLDYLVNSGNYERYMDKLVQAFNPGAAQSVMCRSMISVGWDGALYDCDFNQMLELKTNTPAQHISDFDAGVFMQREIVTRKHCYGCTAGAGSSCGGATA